MSDDIREQARRLLVRVDGMPSEGNIDLLVEFALSERTRAKEEQREALAQMMLRNSFATGHGDTHADLLAELEAQIGELRAIRQGT